MKAGTFVPALLDYKSGKAIYPAAMKAGTFVPALRSTRTRRCHND